MCPPRWLQDPITEHALEDENKNLPAVQSADDTDDAAVDATTTAWMRADNVVKAINAALEDGHEPLPLLPTDYVFRKKDRAVVRLTTEAVFEIIGGVPAYAQWAKHNKEKFYANIWSRLPEDGAGGASASITIISEVPETPADRTTLDLNGQAVIDADYTED